MKSSPAPRVVFDAPDGIIGNVATSWGWTPEDIEGSVCSVSVLEISWRVYKV